MRLFLVLIGLVAMALAIPFFLPKPEHGMAPGVLPWQVEALPEGRSRALGLELPGSTLQDARQRFGDDFEIGLIANPDGALALEAYFSRARLGFVTGKLVFTMQARPQELAALAARAPDSEALRSGARKLVLSASDRTAAVDRQIASIAFIPSVDLDEAAILRRFGAPQQRLPASDGAEHLLYPDRGLDLLLDPAGKEVLQYVAPRDFDAVLEPLAARNGNQ